MRFLLRFCVQQAVTKKSAEEMNGMNQEKTKLTQSCARLEEVSVWSHTF